MRSLALHARRPWLAALANRFAPGPAWAGRQRWMPAPWSLPLLVAAAFTAVLVAWAVLRDADATRARHLALQADALSVEAQLRARLDVESARLRGVAARLPDAARLSREEADRLLAGLPEVGAGLERLWRSLVWLDGDNRLVASVERAARADGALGTTLHLSVPAGASAPGGGAATHPGRLVARYDPAELLRSGDFWWLALQYEVSLVTPLGEVIASTSAPGQRAVGERHEKLFEPITDATLRLTRRVAAPAWWSDERLLLLAGALLGLSAAASLGLRRQMHRTERAERDARQEASWRRAMEESALVGLRARDLDGRILHVNKTLCEMVGYSREELVGLVPPLPFWPPEGMDELMTRNRSTLQGRAPREGYETRWRHRDGRAIDVMIVESPLIDGQGRHVGWMGSFVDVTERKRLESVERRQNEAIAQRERLTTLGEIASTLAHELNQPLTSISAYGTGLAHVLRERGQADPEVQAALDTMVAQVGQAGRIVRRIRERLTRREPLFESVDLHEVVRDAMVLQRRRLAEARVALDLALGDGPAPVCADRVGLEQVLTNLLRNAVDALAGQDGARRITVSTSLAEGQVRVSVRDTGPGLQGRRIEQLCASFYSTKPEGMGLGLAICRSIVEGHGSVLEAQDHPAGGASFGFALPLAGATTPTDIP